ncbi:MAG: hypothetical protein AAF597_11035, partial [Bacteroidota bacterium]
QELLLSSMFEASAEELLNSSEVVAINFPDFQPTASFQNRTLTVNIPAHLIQAALSETLRANEGRIKSTEFQRIDLSNMRATLRSDGIRVSGNWRFQFRERLVRNPVTGRWTHTPWTPVDGDFHQDFNIRLSNGRLIAETNGQPYVSSSRWYGVIVDEVVHHLRVRKNVKQQLDDQLTSFNGYDIQGLLAEYGANTAASQLGINRRDVTNFISSNVGSINASFNSSRLTVSIPPNTIAKSIYFPGKPVYTYGTSVETQR